MANVAFVREELKKMAPIYTLTQDCCEGDFKVKEKTTEYLPKPNPTDKSPDNAARYLQYLQRAIFYNVTKNTHDGLLGQIFNKPAQIEIPSELDMLETNCDGKGNSIEQVAKESVGYLLKSGRFGLFSDYPQVPEGATGDEIIFNNLRPVIRNYSSENIINWRYTIQGAETINTLIVLKETYQWELDEFESKDGIRYRALYLNEAGNYQCDVYEANCLDSKSISANTPIFELTSSTIPKDSNGNTLKRIPFEFCGTENNNPDPNIPTLYNIAVLNLGHYRNSADYEESCYIVGQPTTYFAGLTQEWVEKVLLGSIQLGSRAGIPLPAGGSAGILQAAPNTMPYEAMQHKEKQFLALGAKLVSADGTSKTATEANINNTTETSILATLANNASEAFENAIENCMQFVGIKSEATFRLNTDFEIAKLSVEERAQLLKEWTAGVITFTELRNNLRSGKVELLEDNLALKELDEETKKEYEDMVNSPDFVDPNASPVGIIE